MITIVCFLDNSRERFKEVKRILKKEGLFVLGFVDSNTDFGREYKEFKEQSTFYRIAIFYSTDRIMNLLKETGFVHKRTLNTIFHHPDKMAEIEPFKKGYGKGAFVVISAQKR